MAQNIVIIGATSAIAKALAREYAAQGATFCLIARDAEKLAVVSEDLLVRGAEQVDTMVADINDQQQHEQYVEFAKEALTTIDIVLIAHGTLPEQAACQQSQTLTLQEIQTNGMSTVSLMTLLANTLQGQGKGSLAVISSVAGDRGRQSNYVYGAAKALVSTFAEGMIGRFANSDVHVLLIKPGFVDTPMTAAFDKGLLWAQPEQIARAIIKGLNKKKDIIYVPSFWWLIMQIIKNIPTVIFKKLSL